MAVKELLNTEIFAEGTWNALSFTGKDLDGIVAAFDSMELHGKVPLKLGHDGPDTREDPTTQFAMGWVKRIWREGKRLMADLEVPDKVYSLIKDGYLKFVSVELLRNVKASTREIPWVLDAVALLGSDQPAVGVLKDLQALTMSRVAELQHEGRLAFARADAQDLKPNTGEKTKMSDENKNADAIAAMQDRLLELGRQLDEERAAKRDLLRQNTELMQVKGRFDRLEASVKQNEIAAHRAKISAKIDAAVVAQDILPAARERFNKVYKVTDDESVMEISLVDVEEFIKENPNMGKKQRVVRPTVTMARHNDDLPGEMPVDQEVTHRVKAWFKEEGIKSPTAVDWQNGTVAVFRSMPDVAARYKANADSIYG